MDESTSKLFPMQPDPYYRNGFTSMANAWELTRWILDDCGIFCATKITEKEIKSEQVYRDCAIFQSDNKIVCKLAGVDFGFLVLVRL